MGSGEGRRARRYMVSVAADMLLDRNTFPAHTRDLSETGVCLELRAAPSEGAKVRIQLFLVVDGIEDAGSPTLEVNAEVIWTAAGDNQTMAGCQFIDLDEDKLGVLRAFLARIEAN